MKPERHVWDEDSTHRAVAGKEYDEVWDYAEQLEAELEEERGLRYKTQNETSKRIFELEAENEALKEYILKFEPFKTWSEEDALLTGEDDE